MTPDELLQQLEPLTHDARIRQMVEIGRLATRDNSVAATLNALEKGGFYERWLALQSCYGSRNGARALRAFADPSRVIRSLAQRLLPLIGDDAQVQAALDAATFKQRRALLKRLLKRCRRPIDAFLNSLAASGDDQLTQLLPFGSPEVVACHCEAILHRAGLNDWRRLARLHPNIAADLLQSQAEAATNFDARLVYQVNAILPLLSYSYPERAIALCSILTQYTSLARLNLQQLAERRPAEVADLILRSDDKACVSFDRLAHKLDPEQLIALFLKRRDTVSRLDIWFPRLTPEQRLVVYTDCFNCWRDSDGCLAPWLVALLPCHLREQQGRHHLTLPALATRPTQRLPYTAFLPWDEARTTLNRFIRNPDPDLRVVAVTALVSATRFHRSRIPDLLTIVRDRRNEQDPVRCAMLTGLADLPPGIWRSEHLDDLSQIISDALNAADLSYTTANAAERLIIALLPFHPAWSTQKLATLVQERGQVSSHNLGDRLSNADVRRIAPVLLPVLQAWETREREEYLIAVAQSLGRRLRVFDALVDILERIITDTRHIWMAAAALDLLAQHYRDRIHLLIPKLVKQDPSWVTQSVVYTYLHRRRQDLLTPFLGQQAYSGRFSTGKTRFVMPLLKGFHRWTPTQQAIFAKTLNDLTHDSARNIPTLLTVVEQLAALQAVPPERLIQLASHLNPKLAVRDAALGALSQLDAGQGVPTLIEAMNDDRARIAIYALRRSLLEMPVSRALPLLRAVPLEKVTVAKEVVRLLGELPSEEAYSELLSLDSRDLHRDVRVALLRALWDHLERDETWSILERAALAPDAALAAIVGRIPTDRLSPDAQRLMLSLLATLLTHPDPLVRLDVLRRCVQLPVADPEQILLQKLLEAMNSLLPDECEAAAKAVFATYSGPHAHIVGDAVKGLITNRRALQTTVQALQAALTWSRGQLLPTARAVLEALATDPLTASLRVELATYALPWNELTALLTQAAVGEMHAETLFIAVQAIAHATSRSDAADLVHLEAALAKSSDERLRRLAFAALVAQSQSSGWNDERLVRLRSYRADPAPLVAAAAQFTLPPL